MPFSSADPIRQSAGLLFPVMVIVQSHKVCRNSELSYSVLINTQRNHVWRITKNCVLLEAIRRSHPFRLRETSWRWCGASPTRSTRPPRCRTCSRWPSAPAHPSSHSPHSSATRAFSRCTRPAAVREHYEDTFVNKTLGPSNLKLCNLPKPSNQLLMCRLSLPKLIWGHDKICRVWDIVHCSGFMYMKLSSLACSFDFTLL